MLISTWQNSLRYITVLLFSVTYLSACQTSSDTYSQIKTGDRLKVNREITIPANKASTILQHGKIQGGASMDRFAASCRFVMREIKATNQKVIPDEFIITNVRYWEDFAGFGYRTPMSGPEFISYEVELRLGSDTQSEVHSLACKHDDENIFGRHLRLREIQQALGGFAQIVKTIK